MQLTGCTLSTIADERSDGSWNIRGQAITEAFCIEVLPGGKGSGLVALGSVTDVRSKSVLPSISDIPRQQANSPNWTQRPRADYLSTMYSNSLVCDKAYFAWLEYIS